GFHFVNKASHEMAGKECRGSTNGEANEELTKGATQHHGDHAGTRGSEGHADTDFAGPPYYGIGHHSVQPHRGQDQRQSSEGAGEPRQEPVLIEISGNLRIVWAEAHDGEVAIDGRKRFACQSLSIRGRLYEIENDEVEKHGV